MVSNVELAFERMRQQAEWGKQSHHHATKTLAFHVEALLSVAEAALKEHESHFAKYKDDEAGCATCYQLNRLGERS